MKANWDEDDHRKMWWKPLAFTEKDIRLIHLGLKARASEGVGTGSLATNHVREASAMK
jgi:hypothetical protein